METSIEKNDFIFSALQKIRIFPSGSDISISRNAVAVSSVFQIAVASTGDNKITAFETGDLHALYVTKQNANKEYTDTRKKIVELDKGEKVAGLAVNCDGTFLAVLVNSLSGTFVHIYDAAAFSLKFTGDVYRLTTIRLGAEATSKGVCINWNPALPDTFAASADDRTLIVVKIDTTNPAKYSMIGDKKMGAIITQISWSPKGKQLTTGDNAGKVCQLKLELDVVRGTMPPDLLNNAAPIIGLCWISTTEWLVAFAGTGADAFFFLLTIKKDQQPAWQSIPELQYGNTQSPISQWFSFETSLLLSWNLVLLAFSKTSEISVVGKTDQWKVWNLDDEGRIDLPTDPSTRETFPIGLAIDLSSSSQVFLNEDGTRTHRASPILFVLTSDGVLTAHNVVTLEPSHPDCTLEPSDVNVASVRVGKRPVQATPAPTASTGIFGATAAPSLFSAPPPAAQSIFGQSTPIAAKEQLKPATNQGLFNGFSAATLSAPAANTTQLFQPQAASTPFKLEATLPAPSTPTTSLTMKAPSLVANSTPIKVSTTPIAPVEPEKEDFSKELALVNKAMDDAQSKLESLGHTQGTISVGINHCKDTIREATSEIPAEGFRIIEEFEKMLLEAELDYRTVEAKIGDLVVTAASKTALVDKYETNEERIKYLCETESFDTDERMKRLTERLENIKERFGSIKKAMNEAPKKKLKPLRPNALTYEDREVIAKHLKVLQRWANSISHKLDTVEDDMKTYNINQTKAKKEQIAEQMETKINSFAFAKNMTTHDLNVEHARKALRDLHLQQGPIKPKKATNLPFDEFIPEIKKKPAIFENIKETLMNSIIQSPSRNVLNTSSTFTSKRDASTQIDQPPQIKIVEKEVPVQVPVTPRTPQYISPQPSVLDQKLKSPAIKPVSPVPVSSSLATPKPVEKPIETPPTTPKAVTPPPPPKEEPAPVALSLSTDKKAPLTAKPSLFPSKETAPTSIFGGLNLSGGTKSIFGETKAATPVVEEKPSKETAPTSIFGGLNLSGGTKSIFGETKAATSVVEEKPKVESISPKVEEEKAKESTITTTATPEKPKEEVTIAKTPEKRSSVLSFSTPVPSTSSTATTTPKPVFGFASGGTTISAEKTSIFGGGAAKPQETKSIFGTGQTSSIFGGGSQTTEQKSVFGQAVAAKNPPSFIFKPKEAAPATSNAPSFSFNKPSGTSSGFLAAAKAVADEGMDDESGGTAPSQSSSNTGFGSFGLGSMSLGGSTASSASKSVFGSISSQQPQESKSGFSIFNNAQKSNPSAFGNFGASTAAKSSIFGGAAQPSQSNTGGGIFGGGQPSQSNTGGGIFGGGQSAQSNTGGGIFGGGQQKSTFGSTFGQAAAQTAASSSPSSTSSAFNTSVPKFGAGASFGTPKQNSLFGAKPSFAGSTSAFGGGVTSGTSPSAGGGFAKYAGTGSGSIFGQAQQQQNQNQNQNIFQFRR